MRNYGSKHHIGAGIAVAVVLLLAILLLSVQIQHVTVTGSDRYSAKQVEELLFTGRWGKNSAHAYFSDKFRPHIQIPFVEDYKVVFHNPLDVEVIIYEKSMVGYVSYMSSFMYFDKDGIVVESSGSQLPGVPWITGMEFGRIVLHRPLPVDDKNIFEEILNLTQPVPHAKVCRALKAQPQLTEISGTMKLDNYSESNSGAGITFKKK